MVKTKSECERLQEDLFKLGDLTTVWNWQMKFPVGKRNVMHAGSLGQLSSSLNIY